MDVEDCILASGSVLTVCILFLQTLDEDVAAILAQEMKKKKKKNKK